MNSIEGQTYCLRWNNHKSNLVEILDALIKMECYVDCTIYVDDQVQFKAHRVVLAANSPYFQSILQDVPMDHCSILFPGVKAFEMRALLEYMYTGEVNVTQSQIPRIMKIAEQLEVKGLFDMTDLKDKFHKLDDHPHPMYGHNFYQTAAAAAAMAGRRSSQNSNSNNNTNNSNNNSNTNTNGKINNGGHSSGNGKSSLESKFNPLRSSPVISTAASSTNASSGPVQSSSSPPFNYKSSHYSNLYSRSPVPSASSSSHGPERLPQSPWPSHLPNPLATQQHLQNAAVAMLSSVYESGSDMNPLKRKKLSSMSSMLMSNSGDTPILRNVLAQPNIADSSQGNNPSQGNENSSDRQGNSQHNVSAGSIGEQERNNSTDRHSNQSNGSAEYGMKIKYEDGHSPFTDKSFDDDAMMDSSASGHNFSGSMLDPRMAGFGPPPHMVGGPHHQKPEWKRYKQYTRNDILAAIECVRNGMSALQASRKFGVPSRTLYDKVKKLGITTGRPMNRSIKREGSGNSPAGFPYGISGMSSPYNLHQGENPHHGENMMEGRDPNHLQSTIPHPAAALLDATFLQQALEARGGDIAGRDALHAMAFAAAAHAAVNGMSTSPGNHGTARSPSPSILMKYMRQNSVDQQQQNQENRESENEIKASGNHLPERRNDGREEDDRVEDLSMGKKTDSSPSSVENRDDREEMSLPHRNLLTVAQNLMRNSLSPPETLARQQQKSDSPPVPSSTPPMMAPVQTTIPSSNQQQGVIVQSVIKQQIPPTTIKEEILDERQREVSIEEGTTD